MSIFYDLIFGIKSDLKSNEQIRIEINENMGSIIRVDDKISCVGGILTIIRGEQECLIPLDNVLRVKKEKRL